MLTPEQIESLLVEYTDQLLKLPRHRIELTRQWTNNFSASQGLYAIFEGDILIYVGETGSLRKRLGDLLNTVNHNFRRHIGKHLFAGRDGFVLPKSKKQFEPALEIELCDWIQKSASLVVLPIGFGRKEIEEYIVERFKPKCNNKARRVS